MSEESPVEVQKVICTVGIDLSSTKMGIAVLYNGEIKDLIGFIFDKNKDIYGKVEDFAEFMDDEIFSRYIVDEIFIEDYLMKFSAGKASAQGIFKLAAMNSICSYVLWKTFNKGVKSLNVATARKTAVGSIPRDRGGKDIKEIVYERVMENNKDIEKLILGNIKNMRSKRSKSEKIPDLVYDMTDAFVIGRAGFLLRDTLKEEEEDIEEE